MHAWCTLYFWMYFVPLDVLCTFTFENTTPKGTLTCRNQYFFYEKWKKGTQYIQKYIYVLLDVLCTFDCTLYFK